MVLSDRSIREAISSGSILIEPYSDKDVQPASVDFHLANKILVFRNSTLPYIDLRKEVPNLTEEVIIQDDDPFMLHPGEFVLGSTLEKLTLANDLVARIEGKSSLGRLGLMIHSTAGFIDPGWSGNLTLELANVSRLPITLYFGMRIGQISFQHMTTEVDRPYGSKELSSRYQGQQSPTASRAHLDFDKHIKRS
ncbi:MAG: dCTP deaminase [SAR202 cluster bacterium]|nr:dCTP deaminase [Myxococcales bacterium]MQG87981.1 dCTP deaminase [SAR202 cluster bacterium]|tara:strand:+ start:1326 stop:1907 length:582 start_codon:yes stop_codon:yes gene_type:complete